MAHPGSRHCHWHPCANFTEGYLTRATHPPPTLWKLVEEPAPSATNEVLLPQTTIDIRPVAQLAPSHQVNLLAPNHQRAERLENRTWTGFGECRLCGSFLDPELEHRETCSTAEATRDPCVHAVLGALKLADPGITTEPRGLTASQSRPADMFTTAAVPGRSAVLDVCGASSDAAAARGDAAHAPFDRKLSRRIVD